MTIVSGWATASTPRRGSDERAATCAATKASERVRLMKPGPLISTTEQTSSRSAAASTSLATLTGGRPSCLPRARAPLAWKSARSETRKTGSAPGTTVSNAACRRCRSTREASGIPHSRMPAPRPVRSPSPALPWPVEEPVAPVGTEEAVLQQAVADLPVVGELGDVVDDAVLRQAVDLLHRQHQALGHRLGAVVHAVAPVGVNAVARADGDEVGQHGAAGDLQSGLGEADHRVVDDPGARDQVVLVLGAAQVLDAARRVGPHALGLDERALAVVALVADVHDGVVLELHGEVVPHAAQDELALADAVALGLAHRAHTPGAVAGAPAPVGRDGQVGCRRPTTSPSSSRSGPAAGCRRRPCPSSAGTGAAPRRPGCGPPRSRPWPHGPRSARR